MNARDCTFFLTLQIYRLRNMYKYYIDYVFNGEKGNYEYGNIVVVYDGKRSQH